MYLENVSKTYTRTVTWKEKPNQQIKTHKIKQSNPNKSKSIAEAIINDQMGI